MKAMKNSILVAALLSCSLANAAIMSDYNKTAASSAGWSIAYQGAYGGSFDYAALLNSLAPGSQVALASSSSANALTFDLFAGTSRTTLQSMTAYNTTIFADNAYWYWNNNSVGFSPSALIQQNSADVAGAGWGYYDNLADGDLRLSWHTGSDSNVSGGWRSGLNVWLNSDQEWQRYVLVRDGQPNSSVPVSAPLTLIAFGMLALGLTRRQTKTNS